MEVEDSLGDSNTENEKLKMSASPDPILPEPPIVNGISNGFSEKPKEKSEVNGDSQEKDKEKEKSRDKDRDKDRHKHSSSSSSKHRDHSHSSSHKSKSKDRDRDKDKEHKSSSSSSSKDKEKSSSSSSGKHHSSSSSSSKDKHKSSSSSSGDKSKHSSSSSDKHRSDKHSSSSSDKKHSSSSSSSKDKERDKEKSRDDKDKERSKDRDKEKERSRDKDKERDRDKERSKDKEKSRDKDKDRSKDKDREKSRDKDKDKERSKDKHKDKSRDKEKSKDDHKEKRKDESEKVKLYNGEKEKRRSDEGKSKTSEHEKVKVKEEPKRVYVDDDDDDEDFQPVIKKEIKRENFIDDDDEDDEVPIKQEFTEEPVPTIKKEFEEPEPIKSEPASETEENSLQIDESMKSQDDSEDDIPLSKRASLSNKRKVPDDEELSDEDVPLSQRKKPKKEKEQKKKKKRKAPSDDDEDEEDDFKPSKKKKPIKKEKGVKKEEPTSPVKGGRKKKEEEGADVWKWWEEEKKPDGVKWTFLEHKGPVFAPPYEPLPKDVKFYYNGEPMNLSQDAEEVATFYARMIEHEYTTMDAFNKNFFKDWTSVMTHDEKKIITDLKKCDFRKIHKYFIQKSEERKAMSKEEKKVLKEQNEEIQKEYGFCIIDGHKEKIGNFKIEPPGLFRGRGQHPKMGKLKLRVQPEDVLINCSKDSKFPKPPEGHKWKEVRHDNSVTWLASWTENVQGQVKYVMLNPSSKLKGEKDWQKYETARKLAKSVDKIRENYIADWKSKEMRIRQRAVALYFIDKLALRAGNEKDEDQADTVGCCSLRVEHIKLHEECDDNKYVVEFDFPGKDSIRYHNFVPVEKKVFRNLELFVENKKTGDDLFDRLNTSVLNKHLNELMEGLTAKVFRTYNASITLQNQLNELTNPDDSVAEKILSYNRANRAVAILCNHQRSVPKSHEKSMGNLEEKIEKKKEQVAEAEKQVKEAKREAKNSVGGKVILEKKQKCLQRLKEQLVKLEVNRVDKDENKTIALGTSKLNYLDPRISVAWCKKHDVPIEKIYNKTQRDKFRWAIDMAGPDYVF